MNECTNVCDKVYSTGISMLYVTINTDENANKLIQVLLENRLVACVNKIKEGLFSSYKWNGKVVLDDPEILLIMKTSDERIPELIETVKKNHPYDCPECIFVPVTNGS